MNELISVVMPTRNRADIATASIASVLAQTDVDLELIVVVDGPDTATAAMLAATEDERLRPIQHEVNRGVAAARNTGIAAARGSWIALLDDDDLWLPDKLTRQLQLAHATGADFVTCDSVNFDSATGDIVALNRLGDEGDLRGRFDGGNPLHGGPSMTLLRRELLHAVGDFDTDLDRNEDLDLWMRLSEVASYRNLPEPLMAYRIWPNSISTNIAEMKVTGSRLQAKVGDAHQVEVKASRYLARQALLGGDNRAAAREFFCVAWRHRSPADLARGAGALVAPSILRSLSRRRSAAAVNDATRIRFSNLLAKHGLLNPGSTSSPRAPLGSRLPVLGPKLAVRSLDGRWRTPDHGGTNSFSDACRRAIEAGASSVSLDVFETVLARSLSTQRSIEQAVARRLVASDHWQGTLEEYLGARAQARKDVEEGTLSLWYEHVAFAGRIDADAAVAAEIDVERELTYVLPGVREGLRLLRGSRADVTFLSDTYLTTEDLTKLLDHHGVREPSDRVISSSSHRTSKEAGPLYDIAHSGRAKAFHLGNNAWIDGAQAAKNGVTPLVVLRGNSSLREGATTALPEIAGAARRARLELSPAGMATSSVETMGTQVAGQMLTAFLLWCRDLAETSGHRHLAFQARDGLLPFEMAQIMPADHWKDLHLEYMHSSRSSWALGAAASIGLDQWLQVGTSDRAAFLHQLATEVPLRGLLKRIGLTVDDLPSKHPLAQVDPETSIDEDGFSAWEALLHDESTRALIHERATARRDLIVGFLQQNGIPKAPLALVDVGWRGQAAWLVGSLVADATDHEPLHLHFGGDGVMPEVDRLIKIERFALDDTRDPHPIDSPVSCVEMFLASGKARLMGYEQLADGTIEQRFATSGTSVDTPEIRELWRGALATAAALPSRAQLNDWIGASDSDRYIEPVRTLLGEFWNEPERPEVELLSSLRFEHDGSGDSIGRVAVPYRPRELVVRDPLRRQWRQGSIALTRQPMRSVFRALDSIRERIR